MSGNVETRSLRATKRLAFRLAFAPILVLVFSGTALASHWATDGWSDRHSGYPAVPNGLNAINNTFGPRCTTDSNFNKFTWLAESASWNVNFHKKLGGAPVPG